MKRKETKNKVRRKEDPERSSELQTSDFRLQKGFSLIELLVVIGVIMILTGIVFIDYRSGQQQLALQRASSKLAQDIRRVQEMAMSAKECTHPTVCPAGGVPPGGYGTFFDQNVATSYIIYADNNNDEMWTSGENIETISLEKGVQISSVIPPPQASINFKPPDPTVTITGGSGATIIISLESDPSIARTITVNEVGRIEID